MTPRVNAGHPADELGKTVSFLYSPNNLFTTLDLRGSGLVNKFQNRAGAPTASRLRTADD